MNYLAHCFLSCSEEDLLVGNFIADSIKNKDLILLDDRVREGVYLHRKIDTYTDTHPIVKLGTSRLHKRHGKYAPVIIDIYFDYLLVKNWQKYSGQTLDAFTKETYLSLANRSEEMPDKLRLALPRMIENNWLMSYGTEDGIRFTFSRVQKRVKRPELLEGAMDSLLDDFEAFNEEFNRFFPDVLEYVLKECPC